MLAGLFRSNRPAVIFALPMLVPLLCVAVWRPAPLPLPTNGMPLYLLANDLLGGPGVAQAVVTLLLIMLIGVQLTGLVNGAELMDRRNHLPALLFPVLLAAFSGDGLWGPALAGMPVVLLALGRTWSISNKTDALAALFDAGLLIGIAALFYLPYLFLVVVVWASVSVIRPFHLREYLVPLLGSAVALYMAWAVLHLKGLTPWHPLFTIRTPAAAGPPEAQQVLLYMVLACMLAVGGFTFARSYQRGVMREKNLRSSFLAFTAALGVLIALVSLLNKAFPPVLVATPLAVFCSYAVKGTRRAWLGEAAIFALVALAVWAQW